ncbi:hypothetical protein UF75_4116 [Desulfosporosinus sp. I2]|uniref:FixH family protein n=1 Tax=Desulfosporosinus sp. I2 TaxID=1617025 RepID=UPI00061E7752|nr:FixH family protein [Desulfosporosinus sp. I2]KJR45487.1 hypothetical protein UF75_4116 [Desulfosporosinus sp. I2]
MKKKLSLIVITLFSLLLFTLPALADSKPASSNNMSDMNMPDMKSDAPSSTSEPADKPMNTTLSNDSKFQVNVQFTPENPAPNQPVNFMITVKNKTTGQPVLDASVNVNMMLMDGEKDSSMPGMSMSSDTSIEGQAKLDNMEPGMYTITLIPTKQGEWSQEIHISSPTLGETTVTVPLTVAKTGPNWILIGSVGGIVVLAGIYAQILKRKQNALKEV